ncbi:MAG: hypothetical protein ACE5KM_00425 [Planctomycetaceae bacterium]
MTLPNYGMLLAAVLLAGAFPVAPAAGQSAAPGKATADTSADKTAPARPLGIRQQRVHRMMQDLERLMTQLAGTLAKTQPEQAARLKKAFLQSKALLLEKRMTRIADLLDTDDLDAANDEQRKIIADLQKLIKTLLAENDDETTKEIRQLQEWKDRINKLLKEEQRQATDSDKIANKDRTLGDLDAQIKQLEKLIKRQQNVIDETIKTRKTGPDALRKVADNQQGVRKETQALAKQVAGEPKTGPKGESKGGSKGGSKGSPKGGSKSGSPSNQPGAQSLQKASQNQRSAEKQLQQGKGKGAESDERKALASLKKALDELRRERKRIARLPPEEFEKMAKKQDSTSNKTAKLQKDMQAAAKGSGSPGDGMPGGGKNAKKAQQHVRKAQKSMQQASAGLRKQDPRSASGDQTDAVKELEKALREIEERLKQLRDEMQADKLARLEARFSDMLERQRKVSTQTIKIDSKAKSRAGKLSRAERLTLRKLAAEERALSDEAQKALDVIIEDGTSVVFPKVVEHLRDDLKSVAKLLDEKRTGTYTWEAQKEIELTLIELIEALKRARKQQQKNGGGRGGGGGGEPPLIPGIAELKLLRSSQMRVNRKTEMVDRERAKRGGLDADLKKDIKRITDSQEEIAEMAGDIAERLNAATID